MADLVLNSVTCSSCGNLVNRCGCTHYPRRAFVDFGDDDYDENFTIPSPNALFNVDEDSVSETERLEVLDSEAVIEREEAENERLRSQSLDDLINEKIASDWGHTLFED